MNNQLLEEKTVVTNFFIRGTDIAVFNNIDALDEDKIECIKESVNFLLENNKLSTDKYVSVVSESSDWDIIMVYNRLIIDIDAEFDEDDGVYYEIIKGKENLIDNVNTWIGEGNKYKKEKEVLDCEEFRGDIYKIRKGLYLMNIDAHY